MNRQTVPFLLALIFVSGTVQAEDSVLIWGNYYKEESTRVIEPMFKVSKDLPGDAQVEAMYLVDQISSASGSFGVVTDAVISELRHEVRVSGRKKLAGFVTPGVVLRGSAEPDYQSWTFGGDLSVDLFDEHSTLSVFAQRQLDSVQSKTNDMFEERLATSAFGIGWTQVLSRAWLAGASFEAQILRGYQASPYRPNEKHPRTRDRYAAAAWTSYRVEASRTTAKGWYRFYADDWEVVGHAFELEVAQTIVDDLELIPRFRFFTQKGAYFHRDRTNGFPTPDGFVSFDPKLTDFGSRFYGLQLRWTQSWLDDTFLDLFKTSSIDPMYAYLDQDNRYGPAHIIQLGWYWPF